MNKFRILGVIAIIAIIANFFGGLDENWRDFKKGFEDGHNSAMEIYEPGRHIIPHLATELFNLSVHRKAAHLRQVAVGFFAAFLHVK